MVTPLIKSDSITIGIENLKRRISDDNYAVFSCTLVVNDTAVARYKESPVDGAVTIKVLPEMDALYAKLTTYATDQYSRLSDDAAFRFELLMEDLLDRNTHRSKVNELLEAGHIVYRKADAARGEYSVCTCAGDDNAKWLAKVKAENAGCLVASEDMYAFIDAVEPLSWMKAAA